MHLDTKSLLPVMTYVTRQIKPDPDVRAFHPDYALWEWGSKTWIIAFWCTPKKDSERISYINFEVTPDEIRHDHAPDEYVAHVDYHGLLTAFAVAQVYMTNQTRFVQAELYYLLNITRDVPRWEVHFVARDRLQRAFFVDCQIDVGSSMIFDLSIDRAAAPYAGSL